MSGQTVSLEAKRAAFDAYQDALVALIRARRNKKDNECLVERLTKEKEAAEAAVAAITARDKEAEAIYSAVQKKINETLGDNREKALTMAREAVRAMVAMGIHDNYNALFYSANATMRAGVEHPIRWLDVLRDITIVKMGIKVDYSRIVGEFDANNANLAAAEKAKEEAELAYGAATEREKTTRAGLSVFDGDETPNVTQDTAFSGAHRIVDILFSLGLVVEQPTDFDAAWRNYKQMSTSDIFTPNKANVEASADNGAPDEAVAVNDKVVAEPQPQETMGAAEVSAEVNNAVEPTPPAEATKPPHQTTTNKPRGALLMKAR